MTSILKEHVTRPDPIEATQFNRMSSLTSLKFDQGPWSGAHD